MGRYVVATSARALPADPTQIEQLHLDRQALSLLLHTLHDLSSAALYAHQAGDPLAAVDIAAAAEALALPSSPAAGKRKKASARKEEELEERRKGLSRLLVEMCLSERGEGQEVERQGEGARRQVARILEAQALHLDTLEVGRCLL